jgi:2-polyprenyl-6-methoxyphenol hydroxylase-like FAD-dependent oxidoreductase
VTSNTRTLYLQTRSGKEFHVEEKGEIRAVHHPEALGLMIGLSHRPSHVLTLLPTLFAMLEDMPAEELRKLFAYVQEPNSWLVTVEVNGEIDVWPREDAVQSLRVLHRGGRVAA